MHRLSWIVLLVAVTCGLAAAATPDPTRQTVNVLVLNYDPVLPGHGGARLHAYMKWNDPRPMTDNLVRYITEASGGYAQYRVVEFIDVDAFPEKRDGFRYNEGSYFEIWKDKTKAHQPDAVSYAGIFRDNHLVERIRKEDIREIWVWGAPYFGTDEYAVKIPGDQVYYATDNPWFYRPYDIPDCGRTIAVMGFNYEVGEDNALHSYGHRCEGLLSLTVGRGVWDGKAGDKNPWCRFTRQADKFPDDAHAGNVHGGPNAKSGYDYGQMEAVMSGADDWLNWPDLTGAKKPVNADTWGKPHHLNFQRWWLGHLPRNKGVTDGFLNNWWRYIVDYDATVQAWVPPDSKPQRAKRAMY